MAHLPDLTLKTRVGWVGRASEDLQNVQLFDLEEEEEEPSGAHRHASHMWPVANG